MNWTQAVRRVSETDIERRLINDYGQELRVYPCPSPDGRGLVLLPGCTSILSATAPPADREFLERWRLREIAAGRDPLAAAYRGSAVHALLEARIRGLSLPDVVQVDGKPYRITDEVMAFYNGMYEFIKPFDYHVWSEQPLRLGWEHTWSTTDESDPRRLARVWSSTWGYSGTPDLISHSDEHGGYVLSDFKTAKAPYFQAQRSIPVPSGQGTNFKKYKKTVRQLCLYAEAIKETLNIEIAKLHIIVGTPTGAREYWVDPWEREQERANALRLCQQFWNSVHELRQPEPTPELVLAAA
jgi:hypothetical protein